MATNAVPPTTAAAAGSVAQQKTATAPNPSGPSRSRDRISALPIDCAASSHVFCVVRQQRSAERDDFRDPIVGDPVVDAAVLAAGLDEPAPAQTGEMIRDLRLRHTHPLDDLPDRELTRAEHLVEHGQAVRVAERPEVLRDQVRRGRGRW